VNTNLRWAGYRSLSVFPSKAEAYNLPRDTPRSRIGTPIGPPSGAIGVVRFGQRVTAPTGSAPIVFRVRNRRRLPTDPNG